MADSGKNGEGGGEDETKGGRRSFHVPQGLSSMGSNSVGARRNPSRGIVIHLTGTEGEWDSLDDNELFFSLDQAEDHISKSLPKDRLLSAEEERGSKSQSFHVPLSPSSPGSLGNCSAAAPSFLSPGPTSTSQRPLASLVKSLSTELEPKEGSTLRPKPFLSLVKSISTELSRSDPEVSQSKSDSRLNLHLLKQLTQTKTRSGGDSRTAPPSPSSLSPSGEALKGGFFKMELEDTKRKLSEAVHEPLSSMFSKIMGEESGGSPKHQCKSRLAHQSSCRSLGRDSSIDTVCSESPVRTARKTDSEFLPVFEWPSVRHLTGLQHSLCPVHHQKQHHKEEELEICTDGDMMQVFAFETLKQAKMSSGHQAPVAKRSKTSTVAGSTRPLPRMSLFCVALLSYGYFILPLSPYVSGLALGLALGFILGLFLIRMGSSGAERSASSQRPELKPFGDVDFTEGFGSTEPGPFKGWMNEIHDYDPETCHPALTHSVFATLEGPFLRLDYPRTNISRRAMHDERLHESTFIKSCCFDLAGSKVFLLPTVLARKRVWNPKYPICIQLVRGGTSHDDEEAGLEENLPSEPEAEQAATIRQASYKQSSNAPVTLYLFGRTGREKEEWFRHFMLASTDTEVERQNLGRFNTRQDGPAQNTNVPGCNGSSGMGSSDEDAPSTPPASCFPAGPSRTTRGLAALNYHSYMAQLLAAEEITPLSSPGAGSAEASPTIRANCTCDQIKSPEISQTAWANALIGRIFWDFLREKHWADAVSHKIQKKLSKIRLPYFMNELTLTELDMGSSMPLIMATSRPEVNHRGLWVELQLVYTGNLQMTLQTKFNLSKLGKEGNQDTSHCFPETGGRSCRPILSVLADSDEESSSAGSSDEEELLLSENHCPVGEKGSTTASEGTGGGKTGRKILRFVDKIAKTKCFQRAAESEFIKKKFEEMSNTPLLLSVEVRELSGTLVVNIPAPPTDRIWYSFCVPPKLDLHVCPKLGERELSFCHVTEWIEKKLQDEFQKVFVLPNMDDIYLPLMHSGMDNLNACKSPNSSSESVEKIQHETGVKQSN
ncbi:PREDICTED: testis-expressed sequence 2 protein-like [Cyprinodon variegatus]|uniref:testis-expressed sequence 2 protein-like n=1 Tax=Cyprinodon variegatus TaxID=28743 RepID=UPI000742691A|nr:PREDICTED: testis-expressed sequence 2 protein-like [Cyprinodon variegatus]